MVTRIVKIDDSLSVWIPHELAFAENVQEVNIEPVGDSLVIQPVVQDKIGDLMPILSAFSQDFMAEGREFHEEQERDWSAFSGKPPNAR
jgi:antitoxin VapB